MKVRTAKQTINAIAVSEGAGVTVHRTIGTPALRNLDPFLMLDFFSSDDPDDYIAGFPDHPHRGFNTFTYMLDGHMLHHDSMGNKGDLQGGGAQWMKAGSGVIHSEMPQQENGFMRGFQLWVNLPAKQKMTTPGYQDFKAESIPTVNSGDETVKVLSGKYRDITGPVNDPFTQLQYFDVTLEAGASFSHSLDSDYEGFIYVFEGDGSIAGTTLPQHTFIVMDKGDTVELSAGNAGVRFLLVAGLPIHEPIVQHGPFVMNTEQEIRQAFMDFRDGKLVQNKAEYSLT